MAKTIGEEASPCIGDETVLATLARVMADKRVCELMRENKILRATLESVETALDSSCGHVLDLVWYARSSSTEPLAATARERVETKWPTEVAKLQEDDSNWQHGFNSGCLAVMRLVSSVIEAEATAKVVNEEPTDEDGVAYTADEAIQQAIEDFPELDT